MKLQISAELLLNTALHKNTWISWIPKDIHPKIPVNREIVISCVPTDELALWVFWTPEGDILCCFDGSKELSIEILGVLKCEDYHNLIGVVEYDVPQPTKPITTGPKYA